MNATRRDFVRAAGQAAALAAMSDRVYGANDQINLGFIGIGIQGSSHLRFFSAYPGVRPVAAADLYDGHLTAARERTDGAIYTTKDYHELLARGDVDAVVIAAPEHWHHRMVLDALAAGKAVYCEKPLAWSIEQGKEIIAAVEKSGKLLMVGSQTKTAVSTAKAREIVKSGKLGQITMIRSGSGRNDPEGAWQYPVPPDASAATIDWRRFLGATQARPFEAKRFFQWRSWWEYSGGLGTDLMTHTFTMLHEIMDVSGPSSAVSHGGIYRWKDGREVPDVLNSIVEYEPGFIVDIYVNLANAHPLHGTVIMGTEGTLTIDGKGLTFHPEVPAPPAQGYGVNGWPKALRAQYYEALGYTAEGKPIEPRPARRAPETIPVTDTARLQHLDYFIQSLRDKTPSKETAVDGHYAAAAGHLVNLSYRKGRRVRFDCKTSKVSEG